MTVTSSEGEFQGYVIEWANQFIRDENLPFDRMTQLPGVRTGKRRKEPDAVLWLDRSADRALCEFELKTPDHSPQDAELVAAASHKADLIGAPFFVTWNVNECVLWDRSETALPLLRRRKRVQHIAEIRDLAELSDSAVRERLRQGLRSLLGTLADLHQERVRPEAVFAAMPPDESFIDMVHSYVHALSFHFADAIRKEASVSVAFRRNLARWFKDQGWTYDPRGEGFAKAARQYAHILLNKIIFYGALQGAYSQRLPELSIGRTVKGDQVRKTLSAFFDRALRIDYEPVFSTDLFDRLEFPDNIAAQLRGFVTEVGRYEYRDLRYDIIGRVFERLVPVEERKWLGQFFTRSDLVDLIIAFCVKSPDGAFLDPACGAGTFPVRLYSRLKHLAPELDHTKILDSLWGFDIAAFPAHLATINLYLREPKLAAFPRIERRDFFSVFPEETIFHFPMDPKGTSGLKINVPVPRCRAVVGNPPYTRQEEVEEITEDVGESSTYKGKMLAALEQDYGRGQVKLSKRAGIFAHFFLHGAAFLEEGGRLGFVTSNSWLDTDYGKDIQRFLLQRFKVVAIIESRCERWFEDAAVNTAITIIEECADEEVRDANPVRFVSFKRPLAELIPPSPDSGADRARWRAVDELVATIEGAAGDVQNADMRVRIVTQGDLWAEGWDEDEGEYAGAKWGKYLRAPDVYFEVLRRAGSRLVPLREVAHVRRGYTTGANDFFYVKDVTEKMTPPMLREMGFPVPLPKKLRVIEAGDGSRHLIEEPFLVPAILRVGHIDKPRFSVSGLTKKLVMINRAREELRRTWALKYIRWGEEPHPHRDRREGKSAYHERETCASREPWYDLGKREPAPLLYPIAHKRRPVVGVNSTGVQAADNFLEIVPHPAQDDLPVAASFFSSFGQLQAEMEGRVNFGEGVLKTQAVDVRRLAVLTATAVSAQDRERIAQAFRALADRQIELVWAEVEREDRQRLDDAMLEALGFQDAADRQRVRQEIYDALCALTHERMEKPKTVKPKRFSTERVDVPAIAESVVRDEFDPEQLRAFPWDFLPEGTPTELREFPQGDVAVLEGDLFQKPLLRVGDQDYECRSPAEARYLGYALRAGLTEIPVLDDEGAIVRAVQGYEAYVRHMEGRLETAVKERVANKRIGRSVRREAMKLLGLVEELP